MRSGAALRTREVDIAVYFQSILDRVQVPILTRVKALAEAGVPLPPPEDFAILISSLMPADPGALDPYFAPLGPFYGSAGAMVQLGGISRQAVDSRRRHETVLAMKTGDGTWLYPAWQFTGRGGIHPDLIFVLRALRGAERWTAGVWLVSPHPDLEDVSPRQALAVGVDPDVVARLAENDRAQFAA